MARGIDMKRYQINDTELTYLKEMVSYLQTNDEPISEDAVLQLKEVFVKVKSRPVLDIVIDTKVLEQAQQEFKEGNTND